MKIRIRFWKQFSLSIFAQVISVLSQVAILSEIYKSSDSSAVNQALLLFSIGQSLTFLDFGANASIIRSSAFLHTTKNALHFTEMVNIIRRLAIICIIYLLFLLVLFILEEDIRLFLVYIVFVVSTTFLNLFVNILRGFGSPSISSFTNAVPLFFAAVIMFTIGEKLGPQFAPVFIVALSSMYSFAAFLILRNRKPELNLISNAIKFEFRNLSAKISSNFRVSMNLWLSQIYFIIFLNFDRFATINSESGLRSYSPYIIVFIGFVYFLWNSSSNHAVMNIHEHYSDSDLEESGSNRLVIVGLLLAITYPFVAYLYVTQTLGASQFSMILTLSFSLELFLLSKLFSILTSNSSTREILIRSLVFLILMTTQIASSHILVNSFGFAGSSITMNISTLSVLSLLLARRHFELRKGKGRR